MYFVNNENFQFYFTATRRQNDETNIHSLVQEHCPSPPSHFINVIPTKEAEATNSMLFTFTLYIMKITCFNQN